MGVVRGSIPRESIKNVQFNSIDPINFFYLIFFASLANFFVRAVDASVNRVLAN